MTAAGEAVRPVLDAADPKVWVFLGDSVTAAQWHTWGGRGYAELFEERLRELGRSRDAVINTAVSGWQVTDLEPQVEALCTRFRPDVVSIAFGLNDTRGGADGVAEFGRVYRDVVRRIQAETAAAVIIATPNGTLPTAPEHVVTHLPAYVDEVRAVAADCGMPLVDHYDEWQRTNEAAWFHWLGHGCHPNAYGHRAMARTLMRELDVWDPNSRSGSLMIPA
ncbi:SGNH/GDSL hydrolase family protein [Microbacterium sp. JB110]|uniref:SGNH/GDSL hydrolase family protein n=1 Tax=Microbacterium sp. JB110 TaxID=2024477 RepID=UPI00097E8533|nr:SGNH/GDSL hydrolase family protein [Microbacterium sp. JB110]RCS60088.1 SGNH/GDSL hydrolase family protein [Microbacterium sp. JB110]SJM45475.1 lipase/acylhydrolase family protein [Frigoribacterium sp. JB110]